METKNPAKFIPPELWTVIFEKVYRLWLNDTKELSNNYLLNCSKVCVMFQHVLKPVRCLWLFQEILPFLYSYLGNTSTTFVLSCRLTCKTWKRAVDHFLETYDIFAQKQLESCGRSHRQFLKISWFPNRPLPICCLFTSNDICLFMEDMDSNSGNPFLGNSLRIRYSPINDDDNDNNLFGTNAVDQFWNIYVEKLLSRFGRFITILYLHLCHFRVEKGISYGKFVERVKVCLRHTPNLRRLCIRGHLSKSVLSFNTTYHLDFPMHFVESLQNLLLLPYLTSVEYDTGGRYCFLLPFPLQLSFISSSFSQLKSLHLVNLSDSLSIESVHSKRWKTLKGCLPNLEQLEITILFQSDLRTVFRLASNSTRLSCLTIRVANGTWEQSLEYFPKMKYNMSLDYDQENLLPSRVDLGALLKSIHEMFCRSLTTLIIFTEVPARVYCKSNQWDLRILKEFSCLKYLHIEGFSFNRLEIIRELPATLEYLVLQGYLTEGKCVPWVSIDLFDGMSIYNSELWERVPRLRWLKAVCWDWNMKMAKICCYGKERKEFVGKIERERLIVENVLVEKVGEKNNSCCCIV